MSGYSARIHLYQARSGSSKLLKTLRDLLFDLHRRRVCRAVVTYALGVWLVLQIADIVFPLFGVSASALKLLACVAAIGFPMTVIVAWIYQITPNGIVVDQAGGAAVSRTSRQDLFVLLLTIGCSLGFLVLLGAGGSAEVPRIVITASDVMQPGSSEAAIAPGLEKELRRRLFQAGDIEPISAVSDHKTVTLVLWISVRANQENVRVQALLLETDGRDSYPYADAFDLPSDSTAEVQRLAAVRISNGLHRALARNTSSFRLSGLSW